MEVIFTVLLYRLRKYELGTILIMFRGGAGGAQMATAPTGWRHW